MGRESSLDRARRRAQSCRSVRVTNREHSPLGEDVADSIATDQPWEDPIPLDEPPPAPKFPLHVLPPCLRDFINECAESTGWPPDYFAIPLLVVASGAIGTTRRLHVDGDFYQWAILFFLIVAGPGSGKSPAMKRITAPFVNYEEQAARNSRGAIEEIWTSDGTPEGLIKALGRNQRGITLLLDETGGFIESLDQYKAGKSNFGRRLIISSWDASPYRALRSDRANTIQIDTPYLPIFGLIQPDLIPDMLRGTRPDGRVRNDGLFDRFLITYPTEPDEQPFEFNRKIPNASAWQCAVERMLNWPRLPDGETMTIDFAPEAQQAYTAFTTAHAREVNHPEFDRKTFKGHYSKLRGAYCPRLALVLHALDDACDLTKVPTLNEQHVNRAVTLIHYLKGHTKRVRSLVRQTEADNNSSATWASIVRNERPGSQFTLRTVADRLRRANSFKRHQVEFAMHTLQEHHLIRQIDPVKLDPRAGPAYEMNPSALGLRF